MTVVCVGWDVNPYSLTYKEQNGHGIKIQDVPKILPGPEP